MIDNKVLIEHAKKAMLNAYAPYSKFYVGAALLTDDDKIFTGCNIENASYGATICAERTAICKAVSEGVKHLKKIAIVSSSNELTFPCGICRQVIAEFTPDVEIILEDNEQKINVYSLSDLLPYNFLLKD